VARFPAGAIATGVAPSAALAGAGQVVAGIGNTADLVGTDTLLQQRVPGHMTGRAFGTLYAGAQLAGALSYVIAGPLVALAGARVTFVIAGAGSLIGAAMLVPALRGRPAPPERARPELAQPEQAPAGSLLAEPPLQLGEPQFQLVDPVPEEL
jgi:MFS family permease